MHYRARSFDPRLGRFVQRDPGEGVRIRENYSYVDVSPTQFTDPTGKYKYDSLSRVTAGGDSFFAEVIDRAATIARREIDLAFNRSNPATRKLVDELFGAGENWEEFTAWLTKNSGKGPTIRVRSQALHRGEVDFRDLTSTGGPKPAVAIATGEIVYFNTAFLGMHALRERAGTLVHEIAHWAWRQEHGPQERFQTVMEKKFKRITFGGVRETTIIRAINESDRTRGEGWWMQGVVFGTEQVRFLEPDIVREGVIRGVRRRVIIKQITNSPPFR